MTNLMKQQFLSQFKSCLGLF